MERPDGVIIGSAFILLVLVVSTVSRSVRVTEIRMSEADFVDQASAELGPSLVGKKAHMAPMKARSPEARAGKGAEIRGYYRIDEPLAFVHVNLLDNRSEQHGGEIGLVVYRRGTESLVVAGTERVVTDHFQILTPHYGGLLWYDATGRWVKGSFEIRGEWIDYVFDV